MKRKGDARGKKEKGKDGGKETTVGMRKMVNEEGSLMIRERSGENGKRNREDRKRNWEDRKRYGENREQ